MDRFGERLANGAHIVAHKPYQGGPHQVLLAKSSGPQPWITWVEFRHPGEKPSTGWGHYFSSFPDAVADFESR